MAKGRQILGPIALVTTARAIAADPTAMRLGRWARTHPSPARFHQSPGAGSGCSPRTTSPGSTSPAIHAGRTVSKDVDGLDQPGPLPPVRLRRRTESQIRQTAPDGKGLAIATLRHERN